MFDETYIHFAENSTDKDRIILFCEMDSISQPPVHHFWVTFFEQISKNTHYHFPLIAECTMFLLKIGSYHYES